MFIASVTLSQASYIIVKGSGYPVEADAYECNCLGDNGPEYLGTDYLSK